MYLLNCKYSRLISVLMFLYQEYWPLPPKMFHLSTACPSFLLSFLPPRWKHSFLKNFFHFYFILLHNTVLVLPYIDMNQPWVYMSSQSWTSLPPPSPYHLSGSSPCPSPKHPVSCIEHRLAICFLHDATHVSMPFSQISPSPTGSKSPFYTSVSLLLSLI